jgi:DNA-binding LytR/AlgR family response regulator
MNQSRKQDLSETAVVTATGTALPAELDEPLVVGSNLQFGTCAIDKTDLGRLRPVERNVTRSTVIPSKRTIPQRQCRIAIKGMHGTIVLVDLENVFSVRAKGNYVLLDEASRSHCLRGSIGKMERHLGPFGFVRVHRSLLINAFWADELRRRSSGGYVLRLRGGQEYVVTRCYRNNLALLAKAWIGSVNFQSEKT